MVGNVLGGLALVAASVAWLGYFAWPARAAWRGEKTRLPVVSQLLEVGPRTYPSALLCVAAFSVGMVAGGLGITLRGLGAQSSGRGWPVTFAIVCAVFLLSGALLAPVNWLVHATNWPKLLVPPTYRDRPGSVGAARERRRRRRAGLPETDHLIEIVRVGPGPDGRLPFLVATCTDPDCRWSEATDESMDPAEEERLRSSAAGHATIVAATRDQP